MTPTEKDYFFKHHLPHRLCLLTTFRDRQFWFAQRVGMDDGDLLRAAKDSALLMVRMFAEFLGLKNGRRRQPGGPGQKAKKPKVSDDVFVETLGCKPVAIASLPSPDRDVIRALTARGNKELAHLTSTFADQNMFNTAAIIVRGIDIIERLVHEEVYGWARDANGLKYELPTLAAEKRIAGHDCEIVGGLPCPRPDWPTTK